MPIENNYDIAITGGGLAGLCMAIQSATTGYKTILFEKENYPFHKVCGEYISMESHSFLQRLGFNFNEYNLPYIHQLNVSDVSGRQYNFPLPLGGFGVSRFTLDHALFRLCQQKGVQVVNAKVDDIIFEDDQFTIVAKKLNYSAKVAIGSFGKRSNLDIRWKRSFTQTAASKNYIGVKYHIQFDHLQHQISLHNFADGYCGISKIEDDKSCLCYLTTAAQLQAAGSIKKLEENVLMKNPHLKDIWNSAAFLYKEPLAISQVSFAPKSTVHNHILLSGDSAGLITPLCGNGMSMAMNASKICFEEADNFLQGKTSRAQIEELYTKRWKKEFATRLSTGRLVQRFFGHPVTTAIFLKMMKTLPAVADKLIASTHGRTF